MALSDFWPFRREPLASTMDLMSDRPDSTRRVTHDEFGTTGTENFGGIIRKEDFNPELDDFQSAVKIYDKMRRTDAQIKAMLSVIKQPLRSATWQVNPATSDPVDEQISDFCNKAIFADGAMEESWDFVLRHILLQLDFGFSVLEKVWMVDREGMYRLRKLAPRLPRTIREWHTNREGKLQAIVQYAPVPQGRMRSSTGAQRTPTYSTTVSYQYLTIPAEYACVFSLDREGDNYEGMSILRTVYRNWWFKDQSYRTMSVGLDRWGVGIPVAKLGENHGLTTGELDRLREVLQAIRANEKAYLVAPPGVDFSILGGGGNGTTGQLGISWIDHNDSQIARNVLAGFLTMGRDTKGTLGFGTRLTDMFISSLNGFASGIAADIKRQIVKPLCDLNFDMTNRQYPDPVCLDLEQVELQNLLDVLKGLTGTVLTAQDEDETVLRKMLGLPPLDPTLSRKAKGAAPSGPADGPPAGVAPMPGVAPSEAPIPQLNPHEEVPPTAVAPTQ